MNGDKKTESKPEEKKMDGTEDVDDDSDNDNEKVSKEPKDFGTILMEILSEEEFKVIANHELVATKLAFVLPFVSQKITMYQHMLLAFNEDAIAAWVPHLIQIITRALKNFEKISFDIEVDPHAGVGAFFPQWTAFVNDEVSKKQQHKKKTIVV